MFEPDFDAIIDADFEPALNELYAVCKGKGIPITKTQLNEIICKFVVEFKKQFNIEKKHSQVAKMFTDIIKSLQ